eukprot:gnl/TRDRNA2_/TRDRNA2_177384_c2_seq15.p1 gnl/TRDRNA2_/TRDRNA2_177384_c2~~gnl/TRDRNA2_/TRDRNA2_177384_c2_seq15.p1  ORF type:complete len:453 (+),score=18.25 gnl/TRDRNA2_/TRDRNA2_177384_c2_seq15:64-1359(+)
MASEALNGGVVRLSSLSLDQEDSAYLGLFRIRNATVIQDLVLTCDQWPDCHNKDSSSSNHSNNWYNSAWHGLIVKNKILKFIFEDIRVHGVDEVVRVVNDSTSICCKEIMEGRPFVCNKFQYYSTCPLLTEEDRKENFVNMYETCLLRELRPSVDMSTSFAWQSTLSKYLSICCRAPVARARSERWLGVDRNSSLCSILGTENCKYRPMVDRLFHSWHPFDFHWYHASFETLPVIVAFREYLADNADLSIRHGNTLLGHKPLEWLKLRPQNMAIGTTFFVKELLAARIMPATPWELPPAQIMVPHRTLSCTWAVENSKKGGMQFGGQTYASIWELAARDPSACGKYKQEVFSRWPGLIERCCHCYMREFSDSPRNRGVLKVLLPEHGPSGLGLRLWNESKHIVHEWIEQLPMLLPPELLPRAVVVADVIIG